MLTLHKVCRQRELVVRKSHSVLSCQLSPIRFRLSHRPRPTLPRGDLNAGIMFTDVGMKCAISSFDPCNGKSVGHTLLPGTSNVLHLSRNRRSIVCFSAVANAIARSIIQDVHIIPDIACTSSGTNAHCAIWHKGFHCLPIESCKRAQGKSFSDIVLSMLPCFSSVHSMSSG